MNATWNFLRSWLVLGRVDQDIVYMATGHQFPIMKWARRLYIPVATVSAAVGPWIYLDDIRQSAVAFLFVPAAIAFVARAVFPDLTNRLLEREIFRCAYHADIKAQIAYVNAKPLMDDLGKGDQPIQIQGDFQRMQESLTKPVRSYVALKENARVAIGGAILRFTSRGQ